MLRFDDKGLFFLGTGSYRRVTMGIIRLKNHSLCSVRAAVWSNRSCAVPLWKRLYWYVIAFGVVFWAAVFLVQLLFSGHLLVIGGVIGSSILPYHRTCGFPHPAVELSWTHRRKI